MAAQPNKPLSEQERRGSPVFRQRAQQAYEILRTMIADHGGSDITKDLVDKPLVEDVMRTKPEMIGALLDSVWQLRTNEKISSFFESVESEKTLVTEHDQPILPCSRTFADTIQAHLFGAARLYIKRQENEWVRKKVSKPAGLGKEATGGIGNFFRRLIGLKIKVNEEAVRVTYPSRGLYEVLKPYLLHIDQFKYVPAYADLSTKGASIIGDIFENLRSTSALKAACRMSPDALMNARSCAQAYAESEIFSEATENEQDGARKRNINELRRDKDLAPEVKKRTAAVFADILNNHVESIAFIERHKAGAEAVVRTLAPLFQEKMWAVLAQDGAVENVINCPATVAKELGRDARYVDVQVSIYINQMHYPDIGRDIIKMLRAELDEHDFHRSLQEEAAVKVWETAPGSFNNQFKYQHDAKSGDKEIRNFRDLKSLAEPIIMEMKVALGLATKGSKANK
jgi:hypothetical protein